MLAYKNNVQNFPLSKDSQSERRICYSSRSDGFFLYFHYVSTSVPFVSRNTNKQWNMLWAVEVSVRRCREVREGWQIFRRACVLPPPQRSRWLFRCAWLQADVLHVVENLVLTVGSKPCGKF